MPADRSAALLCATIKGINFMAHLIETMAYAGAAPWHGLGNHLTQKQSIEVWQREAGMDWQIQESPVHFKLDAAGHLGAIHSFPEQKVLYRSDTKTPLSVVSQRYQTVQPREVLEFYRDLTEVSGYELETAGVLKGGKKFWALARTGQSAVLKGNDQVNGYLLLATSCDGTLATTATPTTVRVVCNNTLTIAVKGTSNAIKVPHNTRFDARAVKKQLGIAVSQWDTFMHQMRALSERKVQWHESMGFFMNVLCDVQPTSAVPKELPNERALRKVQELYEGKGRGARMESANNTAWGLLNAVTEYVDHERRARSNENRLDSAWFGQGAAIKQKALDAALQLVA
jgi:phage/plasmid-like protein (TIGR03299 family)